MSDTATPPTRSTNLFARLSEWIGASASGQARAKEAVEVAQAAADELAHLEDRAVRLEAEAADLRLHLAQRERDLLRSLEDALEAAFPLLAEQATARAFDAALSADAPVVVAEDEGIYEVRPDGSRRLIQPAPPSVPVPKPSAAS